MLNGTFFMSNIFAECELPYSVNSFCAAMTIFVNGSASVRPDVLRALASDGSAAARFKLGDVSAIDCAAKHVDVANNFYDVVKSCSHVANRCTCNIQRRMLRVCVWHVASSRV
jgi:hypothetical protein